jgi:hypothetical protein
VSTGSSGHVGLSLAGGVTSLCAMTEGGKEDPVGVYWDSCPAGTFCLQADWPELFCVPNVLQGLLKLLPRYIPGAIKANVGPGLVRVLSKARKDGSSSPQHLGLMLKALRLALGSLEDFMRYDMANRRELWKSAEHWGVIPVLVDVLTLRHEATVELALEVSGMLLMSAPKGSLGQAGLGLMRASARVLCGDRPVAVQRAAEMVHDVGAKHPELIADCHTWGVDDSLQRLTMHSHAGIAAAARQLKKLLSCVKPKPDVSPFSYPCLSVAPSFEYLHVHVL